MQRATNKHLDFLTSSNRFVDQLNTGFDVVHDESLRIRRDLTPLIRELSLNFQLINCVLRGVHGDQISRIRARGPRDVRSEDSLVELNALSQSVMQQGNKSVRVTGLLVEQEDSGLVGVRDGVVPRCGRDDGFLGVCSIDVISDRVGFDGLTSSWPHGLGQPFLSLFLVDGNVQFLEMFVG
ncbi:hypothetical protein WICPIJ_003814 [Wickerhamomyces pijperi]|uniref:Uncharacterized protein n=1 Tax=Wickerhamomyces pijperi TaxID=599730 RepID=A0A9P8TNI7_WICPI|nr:hypothetical protein WICPIJ_003814 [Wickerhamomyces pijperi]